MDDSVGNGDNRSELDAISEPDPNTAATTMLEENNATSVQVIIRRRVADIRMKMWFIILRLRILVSKQSGLLSIVMNGQRGVGFCIPPLQS